MDTEYIRQIEFAELAGVTVNTVKNWVSKSYGPEPRIDAVSGIIVYKSVDIKEFLEAWVPPPNSLGGRKNKFKKVG